MVSYNKLPAFLKCSEVKPYYDILANRRASIALKRITDLVFAFIMTVVLIIPIAVISIAVKATSEGPVFYRQERVTKYGKIFRIFKFRTMIVNADKLGSLVTTDGDSRVTKIGKFLRKYRLDELPQIFNVWTGDMTVVGTRPEVKKYVDCYEKEYLATLLMPAGITSLASVKFKDEEKLLNNSEDVDKTYIEKVLPLKMEYNLSYIKKFSFFYDIKLIIKTVLEVFGR